MMQIQIYAHLGNWSNIRWIREEEMEKVLVRKPPTKRQNPKYTPRISLNDLASSVWNDRDSFILQHLDKVGNPNKLDYHGDVPLWNAMLSGHESTIEILLEYGANLKQGDVGRFACTAAEKNNLNLLKDIIRYGGDVTRTDASGTTALHVAVSEGNVEIVKFLLKLGADADMPDMLGLTPRALATQLRRAHIQVIFELIQKPESTQSSSSSIERFKSLFSSCFGLWKQFFRLS